MKKKLLIISSTILLTFIISFIGIKNSNIPLSTNNLSATVDITYNNVDELAKDADIIADININDLEYFEYENVPFTLSKAMINEIYKGNINNTESINILETGGIINNVEYIIEDEKVMKKGENAIVFLQTYEGPIKPDKNKYVVLGVYQGKFKFNKNKSELVTPSPLIEGELTEVRTIDDLNLMK